jgi:ketosteroid isomerase-like protein
MTRPFRLHLLGCLGSALLAASGLRAQAPGYQRLNPASVRAEYTAEVLDRINELLAEWGNAWATDRVDDLAELYWEDAMLLPPGRIPIRGRASIREYFVEVLPDHGHIEAFMLDFDASGGMSQVFGNFMLGIQHGEEAGTQKSGPLITVYMRRGRTWKIRSQVFVEG